MNLSGRRAVYLYMKKEFRMIVECPGCGHHFVEATNQAVFAFWQIGHAAECVHAMNAEYKFFKNGKAFYPK